MIDDERIPILSLAGRTIMRVERDPEIPVLICVYDEHDRLMFKAMSLWCENGNCFNTSAIDNLDQLSDFEDCYGYEGGHDEG